ncbi:MAG: DUF3667 domain-containing protein [Betaproteobacteria bacterium]|nr:MAG: DUF3667 domain-containing protein [Betaproteobacteria bacterium]
MAAFVALLLSAASQSELNSTTLLPSAPIEAHACRNCGTPAPGKYCPECGQDTDPRPPSAREFVNHFFGNYIAVKGSFIQTLWRLISKPGQLTVDYLAGRKRQYILPLRLYVTISVIALLSISIAVNSAMSNEDMVKIDAKDLQGNFIAFGNFASVKLDKGGQITCVGVMPESICKRARDRYGASPEVLKSFMRTLPERVVKYLGYSLFLLMPLFALLMKAVYFNRGKTYGEHIVFALHVHAFWLLILLATVLAPGNWGNVLALGMPTYALLAMRRVYGGRWWTIVSRAAVVSGFYFAALMIALVIAALVALLF